MKQNSEEKGRPDPTRFEYFTELSNGDGFRIDDGSVFYYDRFGGWYDEFSNYYNHNGEYQSEPPQSDYSSSYPEEERYQIYDEF